MQTALQAFTYGYKLCALWASTDDEGTPLEYNYGIQDFSVEALQRIEADCTAFYADNEADIQAHHSDPEYSGHDFWLTRNHHGTGFWARGTGDIGQRLTKKAEAYKECMLYVGDDNQLYLE